MKKIFSAILVIVISLNFTFSASAEADGNLKKREIEERLWSEIWHGQNDDGYKFPEASYKH